MRAWIAETRLIHASVGINVTSPTALSNVVITRASGSNIASSSISNSNMSNTIGQTNWLQCERRRCQKWSIVSYNFYQAHVNNLSYHFYCNSIDRQCSEDEDTENSIDSSSSSLLFRCYRKNV
jgi:hypothetical protein